MRPTDLFIRRPVPGDRRQPGHLIAGLQSIRSLSVRQFPRTDVAVVTVNTVYVGANADLVRGFITGPHRARAGERRRRGLHRVLERAEREHDHRAPEAQLQHKRRAHADPGQGGGSAQRPAPRPRRRSSRCRPPTRSSRPCTSGSRPRISTRTRSATTWCAWCSRDSRP